MLSVPFITTITKAKGDRGNFDAANSHRVRLIEERFVGLSHCTHQTHRPLRCMQAAGDVVGRATGNRPVSRAGEGNNVVVA